MKTPTASPRLAAAYIRVSTEEQVDLSPESQLEEIRKYARREGLLLLDDHIYVDAGISGRKADKRPEFLNMVAAAKSKPRPFDALLLWKFSRFARNQEESIFYKSILRSKCGVEVLSVSEPIDPGPFGSLNERIIEWMDEFYSIRLSQEVKRSMTVNAEKGVLQSNPSFGYSMQDGKLVPKEDEASIIRSIFEDFVSGKGLYPIARELNAMGVRTHRGNAFENRTVEYIIRNPVYIGKLRWNPAGRSRRDFTNENIIVAQGSHEPLISMELWEAAQRRMDEVKAQWGYKARPTSDLKGWPSGIVRCASCGATLVFTLPHYYKCNNYARGRCATSQHVRADLLEAAIIERLTLDAESSDPLNFKLVYSPGNGGDELAMLEASQKSLKTKKARLQDAYLNAVIDLDAFAEAKAALELSEADNAARIAELRSRADPEQNAAALRSGIAEALKTLTAPDATIEQKNNAARSVIESCTFNKASNLLSVTYRYIF